MGSGGVGILVGALDVLGTPARQRTRSLAACLRSVQISNQFPSRLRCRRRSLGDRAMPLRTEEAKNWPSCTDQAVGVI